ncbi:MAG: LPS assembly protein LptD [Rhodanobacteraceae bacterium]|nr:LPS assembly protein LptD [Rhodanobacteraceae bacterium]
MTRSQPTSRWLLLGLALSPLSAALAAQLCPVDPWRCERGEQGWQCSGQPQALAAGSADAAARAAAATELNGDQLEGVDGKQMVLKGNASATRADQSMRAERIEYDIGKDSAVASGNVHYEDAGNVFYATQARADMAADSTELSDVRYALKERRGQGRAAKVTTNSADQTTLEGVTYTACPGEDPSWQIEARSLVIDRQAGQATAEDFKVRIGGIPVLYSPYASFPIDDRRKSGWLAPKIGGGSDGFDFAAPYYWNIAPNYDATLVPRVISDRGNQAGGEFRYLYSGGSGQIDGEWLPDDDQLGIDRERLRLRHYGSLLPGVRLDADINHVSDDRYFVDLGDSMNTSSTSVLGSMAQLSGGGRKWHWSVLADEYELILPDTDERFQEDPYKRLPRLAFSYHDRASQWRFGVNSEWVDFASEDFCATGSGGACLLTKPVEGSRFDLMPYLGYDLERSYGFLRARGSLRYTSYDLDLAPSDAPTFTDASVSRTTPIFSLDSGLVFERPNAFGDSGLRQTLEPRVYYLYVPQREQSDLPVFDTAELDFSFAQLFRENRYTGADRQADANQLTLALSSRLLDDADGAERAALNVGQIYYFDDPSVYLPDEIAAGVLDERQRSAYVAEIRARLSGTWSVSGGLRYDPEAENTDFGAVRLQKRFGQAGLMNIGYRYRPGELEQGDLSALVPINDHWRGVFRWNYSLRESTTLEAVAGFEYVSCCYSVRLLGRNYLRGIGTERRTAVFLEFELTGLGSLGRDTGDFLRRAILGYQPFGGISE